MLICLLCLTRNGPRSLDVAPPDELCGRRRHVQVAPLALDHAAQLVGQVLAHAEPVVPRDVVMPADVGSRRRRRGRMVRVVVVAAVYPLAARHLDLAERMKVREGGLRLM